MELIAAGTAPDRHQVQWDLTAMRIDEWMRDSVFHFRWWLLLVLFMISAFVWWKTVDKSRLNEMLLYTALITIITLVLDELGEELTLWDYPIDLIPLFPPLSAIDLACLPLIYSLIYQYFPTWKRFAVATAVMAAIFCFVLEPVFVLTGIYQKITWKHYYGFPIYIVMALCTKAAVIMLYKIMHRAESNIK